MKRISALVFGGLAAGLLAGCGGEPASPTAASVAPVGKAYLLASEPVGGKDVLADRDSEHDGKSNL